MSVAGLEAGGIVLKNGAEDALIECLDAVMAGGRAIDPKLLQRALDLAKNGGVNDPLTALAPP